MPFQRLEVRTDLAVPAATAIFPPGVLENSIGAILVGTFISLILLGVIFLLGYRYACTYPDDSPWLKTVVRLDPVRRYRFMIVPPAGQVAFAVLLEAVSSGLSMHICYHYLVTNYFHPEKLQQGVWSIDATPCVAGVTLVLTQSFFARRLWVLGPRFRPVVVLACIFYCAELGTIGAAIGNTVLINDGKVVSITVPVTTYLLSSAFALAVIANLMLSTSLAFVLHHKRTGFKSTDAMLNALISYTVKTGLLNGIFDLITMILAYTRPYDGLYTAVGLPGAKIYAITLLAALHSRRTVREKGLADSEDGSPSDAVFGVSPSAHTGHNADAPLSSRHGRSGGDQTMATADNLDVIELKAMSRHPAGNEKMSPGHSTRRYSGGSIASSL